MMILNLNDYDINVLVLLGNNEIEDKNDMIKKRNLGKKYLVIKER